MAAGRMSEFKFWSQHVIPLTYDESVSYYETLCKIIENINGLIENLEADAANIDTLHDAFLDLQDYVNTIDPSGGGSPEAWEALVERIESAAQTAETAATNAAQYASNSANSAASSAESSADAAGYASNAANSASSAASSASDSASSATSSAEMANSSATSATNAANSAINASTMASNAATSATQASQSASDAEDAAESIGDISTDAETYSLVSEGYAVGKQNGTDVGNGSPYYHNNAKYFVETFPRPYVVTLSNPASVALNDNTEYYISNAEAITFTYPQNEHWECWIKVTTVAEGTIAFTFPQSSYIGNTPEYAAGETWEISIKDGVIVAGKVE